MVRRWYRARQHDGAIIHGIVGGKECLTRLLGVAPQGCRDQAIHTAVTHLAVFITEATNQCSHDMAIVSDLVALVVWSVWRSRLPSIHTL